MTVHRDKSSALQGVCISSAIFIPLMLGVSALAGTPVNWPVALVINAAIALAFAARRDATGSR